MDGITLPIDFREMTDCELIEFAERVHPESGDMHASPTVTDDCDPPPLRVFTREHGFAVVVDDTLRTLFVTPAYRRQGIGLALVREVVKAMGHGPLWLTCEQRHRAFFGRAGFRLEYRRRGAEHRRMIRLARQ